MTEDYQIRIDPRTASDESRIIAVISEKYRLNKSRFKKIQIVKRSIDARQRNVMINLTVRCYLDEMPESTRLYEPYVYGRVDHVFRDLVFQQVYGFGFGQSSEMDGTQNGEIDIAVVIHDVAHNVETLGIDIRRNLGVETVEDLDRFGIDRTYRYMQVIVGHDSYLIITGLVCDGLVIYALEICYFFCRRAGRDRKCRQSDQ